MWRDIPASRSRGRSGRAGRLWPPRTIRTWHVTHLRARRCCASPGRRERERQQAPAIVSVWRQIQARNDSKPLGLPWLMLEFANSAVEIGDAASARRSFFAASASEAKSKFACTPAVACIMCRPS
jgi:hypothetical protein